MRMHEGGLLIYGTATPALGEPPAEGYEQLRTVTKSIAKQCGASYNPLGPGDKNHDNG